MWSIGGNASGAVVTFRTCDVQIDGTSHFFTSFLSRERCLELIMSRWQTERAREADTFPVTTPLTMRPPASSVMTPVSTSYADATEVCQYPEQVYTVIVDLQQQPRAIFRCNTYPVSQLRQTIHRALQNATVDCFACQPMARTCMLCASCALA